ncbi:MAG TPA: hypothetical protein VII06_19090 [Chloroflexota bacterium]
MLSHLERINLFLDDVPDDFLRETVRALDQLYPSTYDETAELPAQYQRYLRPHLLRTKAEIGVLTLARRCQLACDSRRNRSKDAHALILTDHVVLTVSRTDGPAVPPRRAAFRVNYAKLANHWLPLPEFAHEQAPVEVREDDPRIYVVIAHGPTIGKWRDLGFAYANFLAEDGVSYTGQGIDLLRRYAAASPEADVEQVQEPEFPPQVDDEHAGGKD